MRLSKVNNSTELIFEHRPKIILMRFLLLSFLSIWILGFLLPEISSTNNFKTNFLLSKIYSTVCHQESAKCISIGGASMLVCARCSGIYAGALTASLFSLLLIVPSISLKVFMLSLIPLVIDVFFTFTGVYVYSQSLAFATGFIFGNVVYLFLQSELENLFVNNLYPGNE